MAETRMLVADHHPFVREGIRALMATDDSIEIVGEATNGREAVERAAQLLPDVVVMDIAMPVMDGLEATRLIRRHDPDIRVVLLSDCDDAWHMMSGFQSGASGLVPKDALATELLSAVRTAQRGLSFLCPSIAAMVVENLRDNGA